MEAAEKAAELTHWLREAINGAGAEGAVVGLSGGVDSSVTAALCKRAFPHQTLGVFMDCHSAPRDRDDAERVARQFDIPLAGVSLDAIYDGLLASLHGALAKDLPEPGRGEREHLAAANMKPRLRMTTLYYFANRYNYLVVGTGNRVELEVGYFTKYGDGGVDLEPLGNLLKGEVYTLAEHLGVPKAVLERPPSAGLWQGQTDEEEMGITYQELDRYLSSGAAPANVQERIEEMRRASHHKRRLPAAPGEP